VTTLCCAVLNYVPCAGTEEGPAAVEVAIRDGRVADLPGWTECGFQLIGHSSAMQDWGDDDEIARVHYPEIEALACRLTGSDFALVSDHVRRTGRDAKRDRDQSPVSLVHSDFADNYAEVIRNAYRDVRRRGAATLARNRVSAQDVATATRIMMLQFWRNLGPAKMDYPLAFCDARTLTRAEARPFRYTGYVAGGRSFDALAIVAPEDPDRHHWYSFPEMTPDEVVAFRTYDTELVRSGETYFTPHSAFRDPDVEIGRPARSSIELRVACLFR
jgi:hypothetical protein